MSKLCHSGKVVFILDGIDEAIVSEPMISQLILRFAEEYPKAQVITSCRTSSSYNNILPFVTLTLLPFSKSQRNAFIDGWFKNKKERGKAKRIIKNHLNSHPNIAKVVNCPLLATLMCTLQENNIPLPENEIRLYNSRLDLLLGLYDVYKKAKRLKSYTDELLAVAEYIAYTFHIEYKREAKHDEIISIIDEFVKNEKNKLRYRQAVEELISPCEILVPMTDDGKVGFGHLRFQEHLVARYLCMHRDIEIVPFSHEEWWYEVLVFLARMQTNIEWLVNILAADAYKSSEYILNRIILTQPLEERKRLRSILISHRKLDYIDKSLLDLDSYKEDDSISNFLDYYYAYNDMIGK